MSSSGMTTFTWSRRHAEEFQTPNSPTPSIMIWLERVSSKCVMWLVVIREFSTLGQLNMHVTPAYVSELGWATARVSRAGTSVQHKPWLEQDALNKCLERLNKSFDFNIYCTACFGRPGWYLASSQANQWKFPLHSSFKEPRRVKK